MTIRGFCHKQPIALCAGLDRWLGRSTSKHQLSLSPALHNHLAIITRLKYALDCLYCVLPQHRAIGLQTDCTAALPGHVVRLPDSHMYALWP